MSVPATDVGDDSGDSPAHRAEGRLWTVLSAGAVSPTVQLHHVSTWTQLMSCRRTSPVYIGALVLPLRAVEGVIIKCA